MEVDSDTSSNNSSSEQEESTVSDNSDYQISQYNSNEESESLHTNGEWNCDHWSSSESFEYETEFTEEAQNEVRTYVKDTITTKDSTITLFGLYTYLRMIGYQINEIALDYFLTEEMNLLSSPGRGYDQDYKPRSNHFSVKRKLWETDIEIQDNVPKKRRCLNDIGDEDFEEWKDITKMDGWKEEEETKEDDDDDDIEM